MIHNTDDADDADSADDANGAVGADGADDADGTDGADDAMMGLWFLLTELHIIGTIFFKYEELFSRWLTVVGDCAF